MKSKFLTLLCSFLVLFSVNAHAFTLNDATSFDPVPVQVQAASIGVPVGTVIVWTKEEIPEGWLECNGQPVPTEYPDLLALMPNVPNYQGRFLEGNSVPGEIKEAGLPNIIGKNGWTSIGASENTNKYFNGPFYGEKISGSISGFMPNAYATMVNIYFDASLSNSIFGNAETVQPPSVTVKYLIKAE